MESLINTSLIMIYNGRKEAVATKVQTVTSPCGCAIDRSSHTCYRSLLERTGKAYTCSLQSERCVPPAPSGVMGVYGNGLLGVTFLRESMCAEGMGCARRWARWELRGTGTASGQPGVP